MEMIRALTMAYHPQADGQTKVMNQSLEISLWAYIRPKQDNWVGSLNGLALSYNSTPHTATSFLPTYQLRGYVPITGSGLLHYHERIVPEIPTILHSTLKCLKWLNYLRLSNNKCKKLYN